MLPPLLGPAHKLIRCRVNMATSVLHKVRDREPAMCLRGCQIIRAALGVGGCVRGADVPVHAASTWACVPACLSAGD